MIYRVATEFIQETKESLLTDGYLVDNKFWQSRQTEDPRQQRMQEMTDVIGIFPVPSDVEELQVQVKPNLPWAEDHFQERISGLPLNPGEQWAKWPYARSADTFRDPNTGMFSHTYMERYWCTQMMESTENLQIGLRFPYGDFSDIIRALIKDPTTRQAYLPIWFPEDTSVIGRERVPCSLGYHFLIRDGYLSCKYFLRSCDAIRHFQDDIYLTARLMQDVALKVSSGLNYRIEPGYMTIFISSFHCFEGDLQILKYQLSKGKSL